MWGLCRRPVRALAAVLLAALGLAGCTSYQPVSRDRGQSWEEARAAARLAAERAPRRTHKVQEGESLIRIARRYEVPAEELATANRLQKPYGLKVGQALVIPPAPPSRPIAPAAATAAVEPPRTAAATLPAAPGEPSARAAAPAAVRVTELPPAAPPPAAAPPAAPPAAAAEPAAPAAPPVVLAAARPTIAEPDPATLRRAQEAVPPPLSGEGFLQPVAGRVLSGFGPKPDGRRNDGINLAAPRGTAVRAAENGIVVYAGESIPGFGLLLLIRHADGFTTAYGHLERTLVAVGDRVARGQPVARVGDTGDVRTAQLHFQLRSGATAVDPRPHLVPPGIQVAARTIGRGPGG